MSSNNMTSRQVLLSQQERENSGDERVELRQSNAAPTGSHPASRIPLPQPRSFVHPAGPNPSVPHPVSGLFPGRLPVPVSVPVLVPVSVPGHFPVPGRLPLPVSGPVPVPGPHSSVFSGQVGRNNVANTSNIQNINAANPNTLYTPTTSIYDRSSGSFPFPGGRSSSSVTPFSSSGNIRPTGQPFPAPQTTRVQSGRTTEAITSTRSTRTSRIPRQRLVPAATAPPPPPPPARPAPATSVTRATRTAPAPPATTTATGRVRYGYPYPRKTDQQIAEEIAEAEAKVTSSTGRQRANESDRTYLKRLKSNIGCAKRKRTVRNSQTRRQTRGQQQTQQQPQRPQRRQREHELEDIDEEEEADEAEQERPTKRSRTAPAGDVSSVRRFPAMPPPPLPSQAPHPYLQSHGQPFGQAGPGPVNYPAPRPGNFPQVTGTSQAYPGIPVSLEEYHQMADTIQRQQRQIDQLLQERNAAVDQVNGIATYLGIPSGQPVFDAQSRTFHLGFTQIGGFHPMQDRAVAYPVPPPEPQIEQEPEDEPGYQVEPTLQPQADLMDDLSDRDAEGEEFDEDQYVDWTGGQPASGA